MEQMLDDNTVTAFDLLLQEMSLVIDREKGRGADAVRQGDYSGAANRIERCRRLEDLIKEAVGLRERWLKETAQCGSDAGKVGEPSQQIAGGLRMTMAYNGAEATAIYQRGRVVLLEGSTIRRPVLASLAKGLREMRTKYESERVLLADERSDLLRLARSIRFDSPSAAAQFVAGCSVSGNRDWQVGDHGFPLGEYLRRGRHSVVAAPGIAQPISFN